MIIDDLIHHLEYLLEFMKKDAAERNDRPLLRTSPYYRWLTYTLLRRELFEQIKNYPINAGFSYKFLLDTWEELKGWGLDGMIREGIMHECLYWRASLRAQSTNSRPFFIAPIHEGIPAIAAASVENNEKLHFRGDFIVLWSEQEMPQTAIVDVKADFGSTLDDKYLRRTAERYAEMKIPFYLASPSPTIRDVACMRQENYLYDLEKHWQHRLYPLKYRSGPYPNPQPAPWVTESTPQE